jgi:photosystem II stability/assembly factor-like uncharacterized protein
MKKFLIIPALLLSLSVFSQWTTMPQPPISSFNSLYFLSADTGMLSANDHIYRTVDGANTWNAVPGKALFSFSFLSHQIGFAVGDSGVYKTLDGGLTWNPVYQISTPMMGVFSFSFPSVQVGFVMTYDTDSLYLFKTINGGTSWSRLLGEYNATSNLNRVQFLNDNIGFIWAYYLYKTTDGGQTFTNTNFVIADKIQPFSLDTLYSGGSVTADFFKSFDGGDTWSSTTIPYASYYSDCYFISKDTGWAVGGNGFPPEQIAKSTDGGTTWALDDSPVCTLWSLSFPTKKIGYAGGNGGCIYKYDNSIGYDENKNIEFNVSITPNPFSDVCTLSFNNVKPDDVFSVSIYDITGKKQFTFNSIKEPSFTIDRGNLAPGMYLCTVTNSEFKTWQTKLVVY